MNFDLSFLMWAQLWQVTLLGLVVWAAVRWLAADRPHLAHALWLLVLIKCLTPPVLASPTSPFSWLQSRNLSYQPTQSGIETSGRDPNDSFQHASGSDVVIRTNLFQEKKLGQANPESIPDTTPNNNPVETQSQNRRSISDSWPIVFASLWLGGAAINLIVTSIRFFLFWKSTRRIQVVAQPQLERAVSHWSRELGLRQRVRIRVLDDHIGPAVIGLFRPLILLPLALVEGRSEKVLKPLLTHELIHIRRGDLFWAMIQTLAGCLFWFHPLVRWGVRMVTQESERSCDEETVANLGCSPATYARCLLDVLELKQSLRVAPAVPGIRPVDITSNRMERIMKLGQGCQKRTPLWVWLVMLVCGSIVLPGAALVLGQEEEQSSAGSQLPLLESEAVTSSENSKDSMRVETYEVADLLKQADELGDKNLKPSVKLLEAFSKRDRNANRKFKATLKHADSGGNIEDLVLGNSEPNLKVVDKTLYAYGTEEYHQGIRTRLNQLREFGFKYIEIEIRFITASSKALQKLGLDWDSATPESEAKNNVSVVETVGAITMMPEVKFDPGTVVDANFKQAAYEISLQADPENSNDLNVAYPNKEQVCVPAKKLENSRLAADSVNGLQRVLTSTYAIKRGEEIDELIKGLIGNRDTVLTQAPTIRVLSGGTLTMLNGSQRPFVIGMRRTQQDQATIQPVLGLIDEGMLVNVSPELQPNGSVRIASQFIFSTVVSCENINLDKSWSNGKAGQPTIQLPVASFLGFNADVDISVGQALIFKTHLPEARSNDKVPTLAIVRCRVVDSEAESKKQEYHFPTQPQPQTFTTRIPAEVGYLMGNGKIRMTRGYSEKPHDQEGYQAMVYEPVVTEGDHETPQLKPEERLPLLSYLSDAEVNGLFTNVGIDDRNRKQDNESPQATSPQQDMLANPYIQRLFRNSAGSLPVRENANGVDVDFTEQKESVFPQVVIRSQDKDKNHESKPIVERLDNLGVELRLETELERLKVDDSLLVRGQRLICEWEDHSLSCEQGELELKNDGSYLFSGRKVHLAKAELRADFIEITKKPTEQMTIELRGNSELTIDERRFKADKIKIFQVGGLIYLEGAGSISNVFACLDAQGLLQKQGESLTIGKKLVFDLDREATLIIEP